MYGLGKASINIKEMAAGTYGTFTITYETGEYGIDDSGEILIARRDVCDSAIPQFDDPQREGYVSISTSAPVKTVVRYVPDKYIRPFKSCICITIKDGSLSPGDKVYITYGSKEKGFRMQTFREDEHLFMVLVDCGGSGDFYPVTPSPCIKITSGNTEKLQGVAPSQVQKDKPFDLRVRAVDQFGNIAENHLTYTLHMDGKAISFTLSRGIATIKGLTLSSLGVHQPVITDQAGKTVGTCNPVLCSLQPHGKNLYWGDMHGQTKETVGTGTLDQYFSFGRDYAFLDFAAWQGNDFQVTDDTWAHVCEAVKAYHEPHRFVTFLGYEWSGTTPVGGD